MTKHISILAASASIFALFASDPAFAQSSDENEDVVIVSAAKRNTTLQETPVAVTVTTADVIEKAQILDIFGALATAVIILVLSRLLVCLSMVFTAHVRPRKSGIYRSLSGLRFYPDHNLRSLVKMPLRALSALLRRNLIFQRDNRRQSRSWISGPRWLF